MGLPQRRSAAQAITLTASSRIATVLVAQLHQATLQTGTGEETMAVASHLGLLIPGQKVLYVADEGVPGLVVAAYPFVNDAACKAASMPPLRFDPETRTLTLAGAHINLEGLADIELRCGASVLRLNAQGEVHVEGQAITHAAIGPFRIEGASIDLN